MFQPEMGTNPRKLSTINSVWEYFFSISFINISFSNNHWKVDHIWNTLMYIYNYVKGIVKVYAFGNLGITLDACTWPASELSLKVAFSWLFSFGLVTTVTSWAASSSVNPGLKIKFQNFERK